MSEDKLMKAIKEVKHDFKSPRIRFIFCMYKLEELPKEDSLKIYLFGCAM